jgi:RNA-directed DNA polymerase
LKLTSQAAADRDTLRNVSHDANGNGGPKAKALVELQETKALEQDRTLEQSLLELVIAPDNLNKAYLRVVANNGAAGIDGVTVDELKLWFKENGDNLRKSILEGTYKPQPVRSVSIPKPNGGIRTLGIPTVVDRLVQQAILQILTQIIDPTFSNYSFGFRPGRSAQQALTKSQEYVNGGREIVVDIDLEKFFDHVNHDILMSRLSRLIKDKRVLKLIGKYLRAGIMTNGVCISRQEGTPQGGPLSPLLANVMLDDLDKELEKRNHKFTRYADDCNIYVRSIAAGQRVMVTVTEFLHKKLKLKVNKEKSAVAPSQLPNILGIPTNELWDVNSIKEHCPSKGDNQGDNKAKQRA